MNFTTRQMEIIKVSIDIIAEKGIQNLTIKNISKSIGISEPAIYRHFENKMDILLAILSYFKQSNSVVLEMSELENKTAIEQIGSIYSNHFKQFNENRALTSVIFSEEIFKNDKRLTDKVSSIMKSNNMVISKIIKTGQENNEIRNDIPCEQITMIIMGALRLIVTKWRMAGFAFDLEKEGSDLWNSIKKIIKNKV